MSSVAETTPAMVELERKRQQQKEQEEAEQAKLDELIPIPVGWSILVAIPQPEETYESGLVKAAKTLQHEQILASIGLVIDLGPQAYTDKERFGDAPWCKSGDYVMFRPNSGTRFRMGKREYRLLNDDSIEAIVPDPSCIQDAR